MNSKDALLCTLLMLFCATSVADSPSHTLQRDSLLRIYNEFAAIEQIIVAHEQRNNSITSSDPTSGGVVFNYGVLLIEVREQLAGIKSHIQLLNSSPQWQRFTLE